MAKQDDYVRTQVRLEEPTYGILKEYMEKTGMSMNAAINSVLHDAILDELLNEDTLENKEMYIDIITKRLKTLTITEIRDICSLVVRISQLKGH